MNNHTTTTTTRPPFHFHEWAGATLIRDLDGAVVVTCIERFTAQLWRVLFTDAGGVIVFGQSGQMWVPEDQSWASGVGPALVAYARQQLEKHGRLSDT